MSEGTAQGMVVEFFGKDGSRRTIDHVTSFVAEPGNSHVTVYFAGGRHLRSVDSLLYFSVTDASAPPPATSCTAEVVLRTPDGKTIAISEPRMVEYHWSDDLGMLSLTGYPTRWFFSLSCVESLNAAHAVTAGGESARNGAPAIARESALFTAQVVTRLRGRTMKALAPIRDTTICARSRG